MDKMFDRLEATLARYNELDDLLASDEVISNLDEYQSLTRLIYSGESSPEDIESLEKITEYILEILNSIAETMNMNKEDIMTFFTEKSQDPAMQSIRELIKLDSAIENIKGKNL